MEDKFDHYTSYSNFTWLYISYFHNLTQHIKNKDKKCYTYRTQVFFASLPTELQYYFYKIWVVQTLRVLVVECKIIYLKLIKIDLKLDSIVKPFFTLLPFAFIQERLFVEIPNSIIRLIPVCLFTPFNLSLPFIQQW